MLLIVPVVPVVQQRLPARGAAAAGAAKRRASAAQRDDEHARARLLDGGTHWVSVENADGSTSLPDACKAIVSPARHVGSQW